MPDESQEEPKQGITFASIPGEVAFNKNLNKTDSFVFWMVKTLDSTKEHCWASNAYMAKRLNVSIQTISNAISKLKKYGYIKQISFNGRRRILEIDNSYHKKYRYLIEEYNSKEEDSLKDIFKADYKESLRQPIRSLIIDKDSNNNIDNTIINNSMGIPSESQNNLLENNNNSNDQDKNPSSNKNTLPENPYTVRSVRLISIWNGFEHTANHNTEKPYTKAYLLMIKNLNSLMKGSFVSTGKQFDQKWIKKNKIPKNYFSRAWTFSELKIGIENLSKYSLEGYWPDVDKKFFKSLTNLIYNPRQQNSWLLAAIKNPPKRLKEAQWKNPYPNTTEKFMKADIWPDDHKFDIQRLVKGILELKEFSDNLIQDPYNKVHQWFGDLQKISKEYINWLYEQDWLDINENIIGTKNKVFKRFIYDQQKEIGVEIRSKGWK